MNSLVTIKLQCNEENAAKLGALHRVFTSVCYELIAYAAEANCWSRVNLHHLTYHQIRGRYPLLGSQMTCNAIYSVSRLAKEKIETEKNKRKLQAKDIIEHINQKKIDIYFDRHTLSLKNKELSLFTMEGRIKFKVNIDEGTELKINNNKLKEIILTEIENDYLLKFEFNYN